MFFSIIIPAYNAEKTISKAIESVYSQSCRDFELIVVNDGSLDGTQRICEEYIKCVPNLTIYNNSNHGVSYSRNFGIKKSKGSYLFFLDADDEIEKDCLELLYNKLSFLEFEPDIVFGQLVNTSKNGEFIYDYFKGRDLIDIDGEEIMKVLYGNKKVFSSPIMSQIYRRLFIIENSLFFDETLFVSEDQDWRFSLLQKAKKFYSVDCVIYRYRMDNQSSVSNTSYTLAKYTSSYVFLLKWYNRCHNKKDLFSRTITRLVANDYANHAVFINQIEDMTDRLVAEELFCKNKSVLKKCYGLKYKLSYLFLIVFGYKKYLSRINKHHFKNNICL